ncbi:deoxyguanosinetriphosphate triphosphohydrolase [Maridesulfovibrio hydrothermalis]|uniref:Deoxyguanosinetriphosphate triphosphohydrolase-like protein n=1 Tax=Maridesulfovibrio hydrothermalis AM13 = DSM 14728 TaxID=1121451 RepID=L0RDM1_9BACT|nr:deoxyguanosinetriphosphate triphosphohydrolase [Maridesulfovibrio hydrothermalis]CCO24863.1 Deoxyguanosinetriphosphate triphosphohydrolase-like protein [Maridesulfovibrio hydrothermalis AM13 = DSM 14728]
MVPWLMTHKYKENNKMQWEKLLSKQRIGKDKTDSIDHDRSDFQRDFDRIIFSSAFRRLQDKTQVFPLSKSDYVRTRLTHSLETSSVGRSLGFMVGGKLIKKHGLDLMPAEAGTIVATACLAHDIGNPPFGHSGEDVIRDWFQNSEIGMELCAKVDKRQRNDFLWFEGNAQGLRNILALQRPYSKGGMQLTCATLAAFTKYPYVSEHIQNKKKFGIFASEADIYAEVADHLGLILLGTNKWGRHPFAYLVEAADDICYHVVDIEDGHRLNLISFDELRTIFLDLLDNKEDIIKRVENIPGKKEQVEYLRACTINALVTSSCDVFFEHENEILAAVFKSSLTEEIGKAEEFSRLKKVAIEKVYNSTEVIETEAAAYEVLWKILDFLGQIVIEFHVKGELGAKCQKSIKLLPELYAPSSDATVYDNTQKIVDYVSGMTDTFAVRTFNRISGISLLRR